MVKQYSLDERGLAMSFAQIVDVRKPKEKAFLNAATDCVERYIPFENVKPLKGLLTALHRESIKTTRDGQAAMELIGSVPRSKNEPLQAMKAGSITICELADKIAALYPKPKRTGQQVLRSLASEITS